MVWMSAHRCHVIAASPSWLTEVRRRCATVLDDVIIADLFGSADERLVCRLMHALTLLSATILEITLKRLMLLLLLLMFGVAVVFLMMLTWR